MQREPRPLASIFPYCVAHALVDGTCAALVFSAAASGRLPGSTAVAAVLTYNLLAFASQPLLGWFVNDVSRARRWAVAGSLATAAAFAIGQFTPAMWIAIVAAGVGNAVFHLGGGVIALRLEPGRAAIPGLYVAPGAAGLALGVWLGAIPQLAWVPACLLLLVVPVLAEVPQIAGAPVQRALDARSSMPVAAAGLLFLVVAGRAFVGSGLGLPWKVDPALLVALTAATVGGKAVGGVLADRFGRATVGVGALISAAPLLVIAPTSPASGLLGILLLNMTMPITLVAIADLFPERPGFAFGLTCLALMLGGLPMMLHVTGTIDPVSLVAWVSLSAALLWLGLVWRGAGAALTVEVRARSEEA